MKALITGGSGLLGRYLLKTKPDWVQADLTWFTNNVALPMYQMDICSKSQIAYVFERTKPDVVIHCAANGSVDYAEKNYTEVHSVNVGGTANIVQQANRLKAKLVYISSNAVYDGNNPPYSEESPLRPINRYGSIKKQAEQIVKEQAKDWLIIRPYLLYGWPYINGRDNWANMIIGRLSCNKGVKLVDDTYWQPTYAGCCANIIWQLLEQELRDEVYLVASNDRMTLYQFGVAVGEGFGLDSTLISAVDSGYFGDIAPRPIDCAYDTTKIKEMLDVNILTVDEGLDEMKEENNGL